MRQESRPVAGDEYRDLKGNLYQVLGIATNTETEEELVVYQAVNEATEWLVRPLAEFTEKSAREKCFEKVVREELIQPDEKDGEETIREEILRFLDAETAQDKLEVLRELRMDLDETLLMTMELSLDLIPNEKESMERRVDFIERLLEARVNYEGGRLR